jgi:hypothetical protein
MTDLDHRVLEYPARNRETEQRPPGERDRGSASGRQLLGLGAVLLLFGALAFGVWRHYTRHLEVAAIAEQHHDFIPNARLAAVRASDATMSVTLPATTNAFQAADIFARASGYVTKRDVDIGSRVNGRPPCGDHRPRARPPDRPGRSQPGSGQGVAPANQGEP